MLRKTLITILTILISVMPFLLNGIKADDSQVEGITITDNGKTSELSLEEVGDLSCYLFDNSKAKKSTDSVTIQQLIISLCEETGSIAYKYGTIVQYISNSLDEYIENMAKIQSIELVGDFLYIHYLSNNDEEVVLCYFGNDIIELSIYDPLKDTELYINSDKALLYTHFREGRRIDISDSLIEKVFCLAATGDWDRINSIPGLTVIVDADGNHYIDTDIDEGSLIREKQVVEGRTRSSNVVGFKTTAQLLNNVTAIWPPYTNKLIHITTFHSNYLNASVSVKLFESRNTYTKDSASSRYFPIYTAVTAIGTYLGSVITSATLSILDYLSIAYSSINEILEEATLYNKGTYKYRSERKVYVFDSTVYNQYVLTFPSTYNDGDFAGGYDPDGSFVWVHQPSDMYNQTESWYETIGFYRYEIDLYTNGHCTSYHP